MSAGGGPSPGDIGPGGEIDIDIGPLGDSGGGGGGGVGGGIDVGDVSGGGVDGGTPGGPGRTGPGGSTTTGEPVAPSEPGDGMQADDGGAGGNGGGGGGRGGPAGDPFSTTGGPRVPSGAGPDERQQQRQAVSSRRVRQQIQEAAARGQVQSAPQRQRSRDVPQDVVQRRREAARSAALRERMVSEFDPESDIRRRGPGAFEARVETDRGETRFLPFAFSRGGAEQVEGIQTARARAAGARAFSRQVPGEVEPADVQVEDDSLALTEAAQRDVSRRRAAQQLQSQPAFRTDEDAGGLGGLTFGAIDVGPEDIARVDESGDVRFTEDFRSQLGAIQRQFGRSARFEAIERAEQRLEFRLEHQRQEMTDVERFEDFTVRDTESGPRLALTREFEDELIGEQVREDLGQPGFEQGEEFTIERADVSPATAAAIERGAGALGAVAPGLSRDIRAGVEPGQVTSVRLTPRGRQIEITDAIRRDIQAAERESRFSLFPKIHDFPRGPEGTEIRDISQLRFDEEGRLAGAEPAGQTRTEQIASTEEAVRVGEPGTLRGDVTGLAGRAAGEASASVLGAGESFRGFAGGFGDVSADVLGPPAGAGVGAIGEAVDIAFDTEISEPAAGHAEEFVRFGARGLASITALPGVVTLAGERIEGAGQFTAAAIESEGIVRGSNVAAHAGAEAVGSTTVEQGEFAIENPVAFAGGATGAAVGGFALSRALTTAPTLAREVSIRARGGAIKRFEEVSDPPRLVMDETLPAFRERAERDPELARREFEEQARATDIAGDEPVAFHGRDPEAVSEFGGFGRAFEAPEGSAELPGLFQSADLSALRVQGAGESGGLSFGIPRPNVRGSRVLAERDVDVETAPATTREGTARFLEEEASREQSFIRGDVTPEQEVVAPPGSRFEQAGGVFGVRVGGRTFPFTDIDIPGTGEIATGRLVRRVEPDADATPGTAGAAEADDLITAEQMATETTRAIRESRRAASEPDRVFPGVSTPAPSSAIGRTTRRTQISSDDVSTMDFDEFVSATPTRATVTRRAGSASDPLSSVVGASTATATTTPVSESPTGAATESVGSASGIRASSGTATGTPTAGVATASDPTGPPPSSPAPSTPAPSTAGPSTPGPSTPSPSTPGPGTPTFGVPIPGGPGPPPTPLPDLDDEDEDDEFAFDLEEGAAKQFGIPAATPEFVGFEFDVGGLSDPANFDPGFVRGLGTAGPRIAEAGGDPTGADLDRLADIEMEP